MSLTGAWVKTLTISRIIDADIGICCGGPLSFVKPQDKPGKRKKFVYDSIKATNQFIESVIRSVAKLIDNLDKRMQVPALGVEQLEQQPDTLMLLLQAPVDPDRNF